MRLRQSFVGAFHPSPLTGTKRVCRKRGCEALWLKSRRSRQRVTLEAITAARPTQAGEAGDGKGAKAFIGGAFAGPVRSANDRRGRLAASREGLQGYQGPAAKAEPAALHLSKAASPEGGTPDYQSKGCQAPEADGFLTKGTRCPNGFVVQEPADWGWPLCPGPAWARQVRAAASSASQSLQGQSQNQAEEEKGLCVAKIFSK
uniref:Uncharacterized protein n=1 Tax=Sphaerodactylus townsendi TaxID=933632 RepID=A0ACB8EY09_9SAUR